MVHEIVGRINGQFGTLTYVPIYHLDTSLSFTELCALYAGEQQRVVDVQDLRIHQASGRVGESVVGKQLSQCTPIPPGHLTVLYRAVRSVCR